MPPAGTRFVLKTKSISPQTHKFYRQPGTKTAKKQKKSLKDEVNHFAGAKPCAIIAIQVAKRQFCDPLRLRRQKNTI